MGRGHGGARDGVGGRVAADPGGGDAGAGGENVQGRAVVAVRGAGAGRGDGADGERAGGGGGGVVCGVGVVVSGGHGKGDSGGHGVVDGAVDGGRVGASETHVGDWWKPVSVSCVSRFLHGWGIVTRLCGSSIALGVGGDPVDAGNDTGVGAGTVVSKDLDGNDGGLLCDSICSAGNGSSDVSSVAVGVRVAGSGDGVVAPDGAAAKIVVGGQDTGVDDVGIDAGACAAVVDVVGAGAGLVRDGAKTPRGDGGLGGLFAGLATV